MVLLSVVVGHRPRWISRTQLADVGQTTVDQRQHILRCLLVEEPPVIAACHVDWRGVCHYPTPPDIMTQDRIGVTGPLTRVTSQVLLSTLILVHQEGHYRSLKPCLLPRKI